MEQPINVKIIHAYLSSLYIMLNFLVHNDVINIYTHVPIKHINFTNNYWIRIHYYDYRKKCVIVKG